MDDYIRLRSGLLVPPPPRVMQRYCRLMGVSAMLMTAGGVALPANVVSQTTTTQSLIVRAPCNLEAKLWGAGGGNHPDGDTGGAGGYARAVITLQAGDVLTYAAGAPGVGSAPGLSGSGQGNGGAGSGSSGGGGARSELYINGVLRLVAGAGAGAASNGNKPGGGGGLQGQEGTSFLGGGGAGGTQTGPGAGGGIGDGNHGGSGSGGNGGAGGGTGSGGGGGYYGGGGGGYYGNGYPGGGGSGYDSTGAGTLTTGDYRTPANANDPDRINNAGGSQQPGLTILRFSA